MVFPLEASKQHPLAWQTQASIPAQPQSSRSSERTAHASSSKYQQNYFLFPKLLVESAIILKTAVIMAREIEPLRVKIRRQTVFTQIIDAT